MPVTPQFDVFQDSHTLTIRIRVPHIRVSDAEVALDGSDFSFFCRPYLLNLRLPGDVQQDDGGPGHDANCRAQYNADDQDGTITVTLKKLRAGDHFEGLDLTSALLRPSMLSSLDGSDGTAPSIEEISSKDFPPSEVEDSGDGGEDTADGKRREQGGAASQPLQPPSAFLVSPAPPPSPGAPHSTVEVDGLADLVGSVRLETGPRHYGFNRRHRGVFTNLRGEVSDVLDSRCDPEAAPAPPTPPAFSPFGGAAASGGGGGNPPRSAPHGGCRRSGGGGGGGGLSSGAWEAEDEDFSEERYFGDEHHGTGEDPLFLAAVHFAPHWHTVAYPRADSPAKKAPSSSTTALRPERLQQQQQRLSSDEASGSVHPGAVASPDLPVEPPLLSPLPPPPPGGGGGGGAAASAAASGCGEGGGPPFSAGSASNSGFTTPFEWSPQEVELMRTLPAREHLMSGAETRSALCALTSILVGYCYDERMTQGEGSVESAWAMAKLSAALSWLEPFERGQPLDALVSGVRRILCYPYFRSWTLALLVVKDVRDVFASGRRCLLRCLLRARATFSEANDHCGFYLLNKVWVDDLAVWLQRVHEASLAEFAADVARAAAAVEGSKKGDLLGELGVRVEKADRWADSSEDEQEEEEEEEEEEEDDDDEAGVGERGQRGRVLARTRAAAAAKTWAGKERAESSSSDGGSSSSDD